MCGSFIENDIYTAVVCAKLRNIFELAMECKKRDSIRRKYFINNRLLKKNSLLLRLILKMQIFIVKFNKKTP